MKIVRKSTDVVLKPKCSGKYLSGVILDEIMFDFMHENGNKEECIRYKSEYLSPTVHNLCSVIGCIDLASNILENPKYKGYKKSLSNLRNEIEKEVSEYMVEYYRWKNQNNVTDKPSQD